MKNNFENRIKYDERIPYIHLQEGEYDLYHGCGGAIVKANNGIISEITYFRDLTNKKDINEFEKLLQVNDYWLGELSCYDLCCPIRVKDIHLLIEKIKEEEMKEEAELPLI